MISENILMLHTKISSLYLVSVEIDVNNKKHLRGKEKKRINMTEKISNLGNI